MRPLHEDERRRMLTWSALLCAVPLCLTPLAGRTSFEIATEQAAFQMRFSTPSLETVWNGKPVDIRRDPFQPEQGAKNALAAAPGGLVGLHVTQGASIGFILPANHGSAGSPVQVTAQGNPSITAIVTGPSPRALIDDGAHVRMVGVGDALAGSRILAIDAAGIHLENGTVMPFAEEHP